MIAIFYEFAKNTNSTKRPTDGTEKTVRLKDGCSIINPVLELDRFSYDHTWNYCYIPDFERYYFINDTVYKNSLCEVSCNVDVLATWKTQIGASTQYVVRSASEFDGRVVDNLYPVIQSVSDNVSTDGGYPTVDNGCFVIGVTSADANMGSVAYYALDYRSMAIFNDSVMNYITDSSMFEVGSGLWFTKEFYLWFVDPIAKIVSCNWFPFSYSSIAGTVVNSIKVADWVVSIARIPETGEAKKLGALVMQGGGTLSKSFTIPSHTQASARGTYMNLEPFTKRELVWEPFGIIPLDSTLLAGKTSLNCSLRWDWATGLGWVEGYATDASGTNHDVFRKSGRVGVPIQLSRQTYDFLSGMTSALQTGSSLMTGNILGSASAVGSAVQAMKPDTETTGANGNFSAYAPSNIPRLVSKFYLATDDDNTHRGRPLMAKRQLNTLSGYMVCESVELDLPATESESSSVKSHLEGGFYYE